jgi:pimeloyl-ACP methyl ester carboxylesterase
VYRRLVPESSRLARDIAVHGVTVDASSVRCPMLVVAAERDRITPPSVVRRVARRYRATLYEYADLGHMVPLEPRWEDVAGDVAAWLAARESDRQPFASERQATRAWSRASERYDDETTSVRSHQ